MKLNFKTLSHEKFSIELEDAPNTTVLDLKKLIEEQKGHPLQSQKLIYSGKILDNNKHINEYNIKEENFVVFMISKTHKNVTPSAQSETKQSIQEQGLPKTNETNKQNQTIKEETKLDNRTFSSTESQTSHDPLGLLIGSSYEQAVLNLIELGFDRPQVVKAMKASFNNPDRAAQYLLTNSIPEADLESAEVESTAATAASDNTSLTGTQAAENLFTAAAQQAASRQTNTSEGGITADDFSSLRNSPMFQQLRTAIQHNPSLLQPILEQIASTNPNAFNVINSNPDAFIRLFSEEAQDENDGDSAQEIGENNDSTLGDSTQYIRITQDEKEAIDRLVELGFDRSTVTQAYFACDKNEELTANYLFEHGHEDE